MRTDKWHGRRPEEARGVSVARLSSYRRHFRQRETPLLSRFPSADVTPLVEEAISAALARESRGDATFGSYATLLSFCRSAVMQEGRLLESSIASAVRQSSDLAMLPSKAMPIVPAAREMLKRTPTHEIKGIRFPSRVHTEESYKPDLFVVNRSEHSGLILDIKRCLSSYRPQEVDRLRYRMLAVAAIAPEWVAENRGPRLVDVETAIVDGADEISDHKRGVFRLSEIDDLLGTQNTAEFVAHVRLEFAKQVQQELDRRCRSLTGFPGEHDLKSKALNRPSEVEHQLPPDVGTPSMQHTSASQPHFGYARRPRLH